MDKIFELVLAVPGAVWGVFLGALSSLAGTFLTNRANYKRLLAQFKHERSLKDADRILNLKRDIYLEVAEAVHCGISSIAGFSNTEISEAAVFEEYRKKAPAIFKAHVVAGSELTPILLTISSNLSEEMLKLMNRRVPVMLLAKGVQVQRELIQKMMVSQDAYIQLMKSHLVNAERDSEKWRAINNGFEFESGRLLDANANLKKLESELQMRRLQFAMECSNAAVALSTELTPLLAQVRIELGLSFDADLFEQQLRSSLDRQKLAMADLVASLQQIGSGDQSEAVATPPT